AERLQRRGNNKRSFQNRPGKRFDPEAVASAEYCTLLTIPDDKSKHAIEAVDDFMPPMSKSFKENFGIRVGLKLDPLSSQFFSQFFEIVNFTIKYDDKPPITALHRLLPGREIDNRQAPMQKHDTILTPLAHFVWAAMLDGIESRLRCDHINVW